MAVLFEHNYLLKISLATSDSLSRGSPTPYLFCALMRNRYSWPGMRPSIVNIRSLGAPGTGIHVFLLATRLSMV